MANVLEVNEGALVTNLRKIAYLSDPQRCRGVADAATASDFMGVIAPSVLVQYRGGEPIPFSDRSSGKTIGLPIQEYRWLSWWVFIFASSFGAAGEGRIGEQIGADANTNPSAYQMISDVEDACIGFQINPDHDSRLEWNGDGYLTTKDGKIVYISKWRHRQFKLGTISS